jgi:hypothetical protein
MLEKRLKNDLFACGIAGLPKTIFVAERQWRLVRTFKHDFFAATGLYQSAHHSGNPDKNAERVVLKVSRIQSFFGFPLAWTGRFLKQREYRLLTQVQTLVQVPQLVGEYGRNGFVYRFIEGQSLDEKPQLPDTFFDDLKSLLHRMHTLGICYLDFNKRGNILIGKDKRPYMIDFQISTLLDRPFCRRLCHLLQREDYYHLLKHKRRLRPDLLTESERALSKHRSLPIRIHRFLTVPLRTLRRRLLGLLYRKKLLTHDDSFDPTPENNPARFDS